MILWSCVHGKEEKETAERGKDCEHFVGTYPAVTFGQSLRDQHSAAAGSLPQSGGYNSFSFFTFFLWQPDWCGRSAVAAQKRKEKKKKT